jgi:uncharacterized protein (TIGR02145 family)
MKKIFYCLLFVVIAFVTYPQQMVVQKTDGSNLFIDLNTIDMVNFIVPCPGTETVDYAGKIYNTIQMGNQCWLKENLNVGVMSSPSNNGVIEKYCFNNIEDSCTKYGGLYYWQEAMQYSGTEGAKGICPTGWHIPTLAEFQTLTTTVGNDGNALKAIGQGSGSGAGTNTSGFSAMLAGDRSINGYFYNLDHGYFWSSTEFSASTAYFLYLYYSDSVIYTIVDSKDYGFSVRCLRD